MTGHFASAFRAIEGFVKEVLPGAQIVQVGEEGLRIKSGPKSLTVMFDRDLLDDFELVLEGSQPVPYSNGVRSEVRLELYVALGEEGTIPNVMFGLLPVLRTLS
jgi:uncharacterized protein (DUF1499 family)